MLNTVLLIVSLLTMGGILIFLLRQKNQNPASIQELINQNRDQASQNQALSNQISTLDNTLRQENRANRQEIAQSLKNLADSLDQRVAHLSTQVENRLVNIQKDNSTQLEKMRHTVDEKLQGTLEKRLGESFQQVSKQLEQVYKGLGEMQNLASGVGDLKKVLTNIKTRGTWGEIQLGTLLEQVLTPNQFHQNVITKKNSNDRVEFAIILPGQAGEKDKNQEILLPIDAKFPLEDYQKLVAAQEIADLPAIESAKKALINQIKLEAKTIQEKYLDPPHTTDYAFLYLPTEGLYAEVVQQPGLMETLQTKYRVTITGPTTILATLNSFQMVFRTLTIQKRSTEVWQLLENIKSEFGKFGDILEKTQKKLTEASNNIELATKKSQTISRKLEKVALPESIPVLETAAPILDNPSSTQASI